MNDEAGHDGFEFGRIERKTGDLYSAACPVFRGGDDLLTNVVPEPGGLNDYECCDDDDNDEAKQPDADIASDAPGSCHGSTFPSAEGASPPNASGLN